MPLWGSNKELNSLLRQFLEGYRKIKYIKINTEKARNITNSELDHCAWVIKYSK